MAKKISDGLQIIALVREHQNNSYGHATIKFLLREADADGATKIREYFGSSPVNADLMFSSLEISCQWDSDKVEPYAFSVGYSAGFVELRDAERMAKMLRKIDTGLAKLQKEWGDYKGFGQWALRILKTIGVSEFIVDRESDDGTYNDYYRYPVTDLVSEIENALVGYRSRIPVVS